MKSPRGTRGIARFLARALFVVYLTGAAGGIGARAQETAPAPSAPAPSPAAERAPIFVTMPESEASKRPPAPPQSMAAAIDREMRARDTPLAIWVLTGVVAVVFGFVFLLVLRRRSKVCPRCFSLLYELGDRDDAGEDLPDDEPRDTRPLLACLGCGEIGMLRAGLFFRSGGQCPKCGRWSLSSRFKVVQPSTYMMYGLIRIEEACACGHEARFLRSTPPNQAPLPEFEGRSPFRS